MYILYKCHTFILCFLQLFPHETFRPITLDDIIKGSLNKKPETKLIFKCSIKPSGFINIVRLKVAGSISVQVLT